MAAAARKLQLFRVQRRLKIAERGWVDIVSNADICVEDLADLAASPKVSDFLLGVDRNVEFDLVEVPWFVRFGKSIGFAVLALQFQGGPARAPRSNGDLGVIPHLVFLRGASVAVLVVLKVGATSYVVTVNQWKLPSGGRRDELVAGMLDDKTHNVIGVAAQELKEETGIVLPQDRLVQLGNPIWPSPGGCDERITLFACEVQDMSHEDLSNLMLKQHGEGPDEAIRCKVTSADKFDDFADASGDPKMIIAWQRYLRLKK
jgi:hypothetical protein